METRSFGSELLLLLVAVIWGLAFVAQRMGLDFVGPLTYNGVRFLLGAVSLVPLILIRRKKKTPGGSFKKLLIAAAIGGLILTVAANLQQFALLYTTAGKAGFITGLYVVLVPLAGALIGRKTPAFVWLGGIAAVFGLYLLSVGEGFSVSQGDLIVFVSAFFWAAHILFIDRFVKTVDPVELSAGQFFVCGIITMSGAFLFEKPAMDSILAASAPIAYGGILSIGVAYTLQAVAQQKAHPARASIIMSLESVFAVVGGALILAEILGIRQIFGCVLMFAGMVVAQLPTPLKVPGTGKNARKKDRKIEFLSK